MFLNTLKKIVIYYTILHETSYKSWGYVSSLYKAEQLTNYLETYCKHIPYIYISLDHNAINEAYKFFFFFFS